MRKACLLLLGAHAAACALLQPATIPNFRDVGGMTTPNGRVVRPGILHRSASPANASLSDAEAVRTELGVRVVLDLRGEKDAVKEVGPRHLESNTRYLPLLTESMMRSALVQRAREQGLRSFAALLCLSLAKKLSPSRRLKGWLTLLH